MIFNANYAPIQNIMTLSKNNVSNVQMKNHFLTVKTVKHVLLTNTTIEQHTNANCVQEGEIITQKRDNANALKHNSGMVKTA